MSEDFVGHTALATGSTRGIGQAVAEQLAAMVRSTFDQNHHTVPTYRLQELPHGPPIARPLSLGLWPGC
jgi:hypothetical protein